MAHRLSVVVSQSRSANPQKRALEEQIVGELLGKSGIDVTVIPNLYDLKADGSGMLCLSGISGIWSFVAGSILALLVGCFIEIKS